jgi:hypothetical protein
VRSQQQVKYVYKNKTPVQHLANGKMVLRKQIERKDCVHHFIIIIIIIIPTL